MASFFIGQNVVPEKAIEYLSGRIQVLRDGYWFIPSFIPFQFKSLSRNSPLHSSVFELLEKHGIESATLTLKNEPTGHGVTETRKLQIMSRDGLVCVYSGKALTADEVVIDHVIPLAKGGRNNPENLVVSSKLMNTLKSDLTVEEFCKKSCLDYPVVMLRIKERLTKALSKPYIRLQVKVKDKVREEVKAVWPKFDFEVLWAKYPRREGRKEAEKHFKASVVTLEDWLDIQNALDNYIAKLRKENTEPKFFKMGATWFNNWKDYIHYQQPSVKPAPMPYVPPIPEKPMSDEDQKAGLEFVKQLKEALHSGAKEIPR